MTNASPAPAAVQPSDRAPALYWCSFCQRWHPLGAFYRNAWRKDGRDHICKTCRARVSRAYHRGRRYAMQAAS